MGTIGPDTSPIYSPQNATENKKTSSQGESTLIFNSIQQTLTTFYAALTGSSYNINEKDLQDFFANIKLLLEKHPKIQPLLQELEKESPLTQAWVNGAGWKGDNGIKNRPDITDDSRRRIVQIVGKIVDTLCEEKEIGSSTWTDMGTKSKESDIDVNISPPKNNGTEDTPYSSNAIIGQKAALAQIVWRALFGGSSLHQADTEFYPPHIGNYFQETLTDETAQSLASMATITSLMMRMESCLPETEWMQFIEQMKGSLQKEEQSELVKIFETVFNDIQGLRDIIKGYNNLLPTNYRDFAPAIISNKLSLDLEVLGKKLENMPKGEPERQQLAAQFYFLACLRERFLPEGYMSKGAFNVVCKNEGGQKSQRTDELVNKTFSTNFKPFFSSLTSASPSPTTSIKERIDTAISSIDDKDIEKEMGAVATKFFSTNPQATHSPEQCIQSFVHEANQFLLGSKQFPKSDSLDLFESFVENAAYFCHREDPVDASKYSKRAFESGIQLLKQILHTSAKPSAELQNKIVELEEKFTEGLRKATLLEAKKRGKLEEETYIEEITKIVRSQWKLAASVIETLEGTKDSILSGSNPIEIMDRFCNGLKKAYIQNNTHLSGTTIDLLGLEYTDFAKSNEVGKKIASMQGPILDDQKNELWETLISFAQNNLIPKNIWDDDLIKQTISKQFQAAQPGQKDFAPMAETLRIGTLFSKLINNHCLLGVVKKAKEKENEEENFVIPPHLQKLANHMTKKTGIISPTQERKIQEILPASLEGKIFAEMKEEITQDVIELVALSLQTGVIASPQSHEDMQLSKNL